MTDITRDDLERAWEEFARPQEPRPDIVPARWVLALIAAGRITPKNARSLLAGEHWSVMCYGVEQHQQLIEELQKLAEKP